MSFLKQLELGERTCFSWFYYLMESILHSQWCLVVLSFFLLFPQLLSDLDWVWHCSSWCKCCCHTLDWVHYLSFCFSQRNWYLRNYSGDLTIFNSFGSSLHVCFCPYDWCCTISTPLNRKIDKRETEIIRGSISSLFFNIFS